MLSLKLNDYTHSQRGALLLFEIKVISVITLNNEYINIVTHQSIKYLKQIIDKFTHSLKRMMH